MSQRNSNDRFLIDFRRVLVALCGCPQLADTLHDQEDDVVLALSIMLQRRQETLSVATIAEPVAVSRRTLERRFRDRLGITVRRAVMLVRIEVARQLLVNTQRTITAVSEEAGFSSPSRMCNVFRRELGVSPRGLRHESVCHDGPSNASEDPSDATLRPILVQANDFEQSPTCASFIVHSGVTVEAVDALDELPRRD